MDVTYTIPTTLPEELPDIDPSSWQEYQEQFCDFFQAHWKNVPQDLDQLLTALTEMHQGHGILLALGGLFYLFIGWKLFKPLVMINAALVGAVLGGAVANYFGFEDYWWVGMLAGGGILGLAAWPLVKVFVALFGGAMGAIIGLSAFESFAVAFERNDLLAYSWVGAAIGAVCLALLAVLLFRSAVMLATSLQGSSMFVCGGLCLLLKVPSLEKSIRDTLTDHRPALLLTVIGLSVAGLAIQIAASSKQKKRSARSSASTG